MQPIRVLVVDDSALLRQMVTRALAQDARIHMAGVAKDGAQAVEMAMRLQPDVVLLDIEMPRLDGLEVLALLRGRVPARVVVFSANDDTGTVYRALELGAVDFVPKPWNVAGSLERLGQTLCRKIRQANRITPEKAATLAALRGEGTDSGALCTGVVPDGVQSVGCGRRSGGGLDNHPDAASAGAADATAAVGIAASTGGPVAVECVIERLSPGIPAAFLLTQHLPAGFSESFARRLRRSGTIDVREARDGDIVRRASGYVAPYGTHLTLAQSGGRVRIRLQDGERIHGVKPAADPMLASIAKVFGERSVAVVLSGMGADGAMGALAVKHAGGDVIVQDEATSAVWGMPGAAIRAGACTRATPLHAIAAAVGRAVHARPEGTVSM